MTSPRRPRLGVGVVGVGLMGRVHAEKLAHVVPSARLVAVSDADQRAAASVAAIHDVAALALDDLLGDPAVDAVVIATPPATHVELIELAVGAGRHVLCEKPLAYDVAQAQRAARAAQEAGVTLQVGFHRRFDPDFRAARERIEAGELGEVTMYSSAHRDMAVTQANVRERVIFDNLCHDFDAARWMVGEIAELMAIGSERPDPEDPDHVIVLLRFANGAIGTIDGSCADGYGFECRAEVVGTDATVRVPTRPRRQIEWLAPGVASPQPPADFLERFEDAYPLELEDFARRILAGQPPAVSADDGVAAAILCEAADRSLRERRMVAVAPRSAAI